MIWRLKKQFRFEASHKLPFHDGKCARLHGHSWVGYLVCEGDRLTQADPQDHPKQGMLIDYADISTVLNPFVEKYLDHWHLNDSTNLPTPTSEELARWIYNKLKQDLPILKAVIIEETCTSSAEYRP